jgi:hypothetical protein
MSKPKTKKTTVTETTTDENNDGIFSDSGGDEKGDQTFESELTEWAAEQHGENEIARFQIFRNRKPPATGIEQVFEYENQYIRKHQIGLMYGAGSYMVEMNLPAKNGKARTFRRRFTLGKDYDRARAKWIAENDAEEMGGAARAPALEVAPRSDLDIALLLIEKLSPLFLKRENTGGGWRENQALLNEVVGDSARAQIRLVSELRKEFSAMPTTTPPAAEEAATENEFKDFVKNVFRDYGKDIIEATGLKLKAIAAKLRGDEIFQTLTQNPALYKRVFDLLLVDPELDKTPNFTREILGKILNKLGTMNLGVQIPTLPANSLNGKHSNAPRAAAPTVQS